MSGIVEIRDYTIEPDQFEAYIDYEAIARDLSVNFFETSIAGERLVYGCG